MPAAADPRPKLKTAFKNARSIAPLYTSGPVAVTADGSRVLTCVEENIILTDLATGTKICSFLGDTQSINAFCVMPSTSHLLAFTSSLSLRIYHIPRENAPLSKPIQPIRVIGRAHDAPVHVCKADPTSTYMASGSADGVVKVWNVAQGLVTHVFKGHGGVVSALTFNYPQDPSSVVTNVGMQLITASVDTRIRMFDLNTTAAGGGKPQAILEGHVSVPRGLDVSSDGRWLISGGRDSIVLIWDLGTRKKISAANSSQPDKGKAKLFSPVLVKTIPTLERVEAVGILREDDGPEGSNSEGSQLRFYTGGARGVVKIWDGIEGNILFTLGAELGNSLADHEKQRQIVDVLYIPAVSSLVSVHADQNILFHSVSTKRLARQLIGFNDEIVDVTFLSFTSAKRDTHLAVATNSSLIRVYSLETFDARLLEGHTDIVLALDHSSDGLILASSSKDRTIRLWAPIPENDSKTWNYGCIGVCEGHAESVGAIVFSRTPVPNADQTGPQFMFTGSQDKTVKMWDLAGLSLSSEGVTPIKVHSLSTHKAHDKDINSLDISPNDRLLASGSQDKSVRIYEIEYVPGYNSRSARGELKPIGICKGHQRGVWSVKFSRSERILATGSGDKTIKLWSLDDFSCVKTFEGHTNSVLRVDFFNSGVQLVTSASDGLVKLWNIREEECISTLDNHQDKVWALAVSDDERTIVSGAADSVITLWSDCTEELDQEKAEQRAELVSREQDFLNYVALHNYQKAIQLALAMGQPGRLFSLFQQVYSSRVDEEAITGSVSVDEAVVALAEADLAKLLRYVRDWNTSGKTSPIAQNILHVIVKQRPAEDLLKAFESESAERAFDSGNFIGPMDPKASVSAAKELVDALLPYTERHLARLDRLVQDSYMIDYVLSEMDDGMFDEELQDDMDIDIGIAT